MDVNHQDKAAMILNTIVTRGEQNEHSGTGSGFGRIVLILSGVAALVACLITLAYGNASPLQSTPK